MLSATPTVFITLYSNFALWLFTHWRCAPLILCNFFFTFLTDVELRHFQAVFIPFYSNFVLWLFTHWTCTPYIYANLILYFWVFNLEIVKSPTVDYIVKFGCNLISFLYIWTLHIDCSHTDVHRRRRSRAEFGLVALIALFKNSWKFAYKCQWKPVFIRILRKFSCICNFAISVWIFMKSSPKCRTKKLGMIYTILRSFCFFSIEKGLIYRLQIRPRKIPVWTL